MVIKSGQDIENLHKQMSEQFERYVQATDSGEAPSTVLGDTGALIEQARTSLEAAIRDRDEGLRMANLKIERRRKELASLEKHEASRASGAADRVTTTSESKGTEGGG